MTISLVNLPPLGPQDLRLEGIKEIRDINVILSPLAEIPPTKAAYKRVVSNDEEVQELDPDLAQQKSVFSGRPSFNVP